MRIIGEHPVAQSHPAKNIYIGQRDAQKLVDLICEERGIPKHRVVYTGKKTKRLGGKYFHYWKEIKIHRLGENVNCILHEIAHFENPNHGMGFKGSHLHNLRLWDTKFKQMFPDLKPFVVPERTDFSPVRRQFRNLVIEAMRKPEPKPEPKVADTFDDIVDFILYVCDILDGMVRNNTLTMAQIGKVLVEEGGNNRGNILLVKQEMVSRGVQVR